MQITADCPHCRGRYHFVQEMRGKRVRCANRSCRQVFTVQDKNEPPHANSANGGPKPDSGEPGSDPSAA
jgi:hypothetical protein